MCSGAGFASSTVPAQIIFERHGQLCRIWMVARHGFKNKEMNCVPLQPATWGNLWSEQNVLRLCNEVSNAFPPDIKVLLGGQASISVFHSDKSNVYILYIKASSVSPFVVFKKGTHETIFHWILFGQNHRNPSSTIDVAVHTHWFNAQQYVIKFRRSLYC